MSAFGVEKEEGKVEGILAAIYQSAFGQDVYPSFFSSIVADANLAVVNCVSLYNFSIVHFPKIC